MIFNGQPLNEKKTLACCGIGAGSELYLKKDSGSQRSRQPAADDEALPAGALPAALSEAGGATEGSVVAAAEATASSPVQAALVDYAEVPAPKRPASDQGGSPLKKAKVEAIAATSADDELASSQPEAVPGVPAGAFVAVAPADHSETEGGASAVETAKPVVASSLKGPAESELVGQADVPASTVAPLRPMPGAVPPTAVHAQPAGEPGEPS